MSLLAIHRILILSFVAFSMLFGLKMLRRYLDGGGGGGLAGAIVAAVVAVAGIVYLVKAPHLRR